MSRLSRSQFKLVLLVAALGAVLLACFLFSDAPPKAPPPAEVALGDFLDWNLAKPSLLADQSRTLTTERLFDLGADGRYIYRLGASLSVDGPVAKVTLKDGILWSDQTQLTADHVVDAWSRFREAAAADPTLVAEPMERQWVTGIQIKPTGKLELEVTGYGSAEELSRLVRSRYLVPIRRDLLEKDGGARTAWLVTVGPYRLATLPPPSLPATGVLEFVPNPVYYRGAAAEAVRVVVGNPAP